MGNFSQALSGTYDNIAYKIDEKEFRQNHVNVDGGVPDHKKRHSIGSGGRENQYGVAEMTNQEADNELTNQRPISTISRPSFAMNPLTPIEKTKL